MAINIIENKVEVNYSSYTKLFNGVAGIGKTAMFFEIPKKLYGRGTAILFSLGDEPRPKHLAGAKYVSIDTFEDLIDAVNDLCKNRLTKFKNIREIGFDTVDELFRLAEKHVVEEYNDSVSVSERVKTISGAYKGFQRGENRVVDLVISTCFKLSKYGYGVTFLGHSKYKNKKDQVTGIEVELLTSSLDNKYYNAIKDHVNFVGMAYYDVEFANVKVVKDVFSKGTKEVADEIKSKKRVICFRDDDFAMDTKSHFGLINEKCDFSADAIIETIYDAIKEEVKNELEIDEITDETLLEMQQEQFEDMMVEVSEMIEVEQREENIKSLKT